MVADPSPLALRLLGQDHALEPGREYLLGNATDCDFQLPAPAPPHHARLVVSADTIELIDLGSAAGTFCNGEPVERASLQLGAVLRLGQHEAVLVPDDGAALLVPIPAMRTAAVTRRLREIGGRAALALRHHDGETFQELMAAELRRTPWLAVSLVLHLLLFVLLWLLLPVPKATGKPDAAVTILAGIGAPVGEPAPVVPEVTSEPADAERDTLLLEPDEPTDPTVVPPDPVLRRHEMPRSNPRVVATTAVPSGTRDPVVDEVRGVGSGGFQQTVAELQKTGLEIVFVFDSTGSMSTTIADTKATIARMLAVLRALVPDARMGIVTYRDRGREFYRTKELPLGVDFWRTSNFVQFVSAEGGGDRPEDVRAGLQAAFTQHWRPNAKRVVVLAGDAPPHAADKKHLLQDVRAFAKNGRSFVHTLVTGGGAAGADTRLEFLEIATAGKGTCSDLGAHEGVMRRVLSLAFGREFDRDLDAVIRAVDEAANRVSVDALDLARRGGDTLARELRRDPVQLAVVNALVRRPRQAVALELIDLLQAPGTPDHTAQAIAWVLQRVLELPVPPIDPADSQRPTERELAQLRRRCINLPQ